MLDVKSILQKRWNEYVDNVRDNIVSEDKYVSGEASKSLRGESDNDSLSGYAVDYFETLETGVPPNQLIDPRDIFKWGQLRGIFGNSENDVRSAFRIRRRLIERGSRLFRNGGNKYIYSNEVEPLIQNIAEDLGKSILEIKLVR